MGKTERWLEEMGLTSIPALLGGAPLREEGEGNEIETRGLGEVDTWSMVWEGLHVELQSNHQRTAGNWGHPLPLQYRLEVRKRERGDCEKISRLHLHP